MTQKTNVVSISRNSPTATHYREFSKLYIPVDAFGDPVAGKKSIRLECWRYTGVRRERLAIASTLKHALVRQGDEEHVYLMSESFKAFGTHGIQWLTELVRDPVSDIHLPKFTILP